MTSSALGKSLDLNAAVRYADYSTVGGVTTWKFGGEYEPVRGLRFRATRSRDIRAASLIELFDPGAQANLNTVYKGASTQARFITAGNPNLRPEKADTLTFGAVLEPAFLPGFHFSVDRYVIDIKDAITYLLPQQMVDGCAGGNQTLCSLITLNPDGTLTIIGARLNLANQKAAGIDFEAAYTHSLGGGTLNLRALATRRTAGEQTVLNSAPIHSYGQPNDPYWSANFQARYSTDTWSLFLQERFISASLFNADYVQGVDTNLNRAPPVYYTDATVTFDIKAFGQKQQLFFSVNNLFDRDPPIATNNPSTFSSPTNSAYDPIGRYFNVGVRMRF